MNCVALASFLWLAKNGHRLPSLYRTWYKEIGKVSVPIRVVGLLGAHNRQKSIRYDIRLQNGWFVR